MKGGGGGKKLNLEGVFFKVFNFYFLGEKKKENFLVFF